MGDTRYPREYDSRSNSSSLWLPQLGLIVNVRKMDAVQLTEIEGGLIDLWRKFNVLFGMNRQALS